MEWENRPVKESVKHSDWGMQPVIVGNKRRLRRCAVLLQGKRKKVWVEGWRGCFKGLSLDIFFQSIHWRGGGGSVM